MSTTSGSTPPWGKHSRVNYQRFNTALGKHSHVYYQRFNTALG